MKLIIFDLDGVLADIKDVHYQALNSALLEIDPKYVINYSDHLTRFDGLKTNDKLKKLTKERGLPAEYHPTIWQQKQKFTIELLDTLEEDSRLVEILKDLVAMGYTLACCSNSIRRTCYQVLHKKGLIPYFSLILSNEDVITSKPSPEIYWKAMTILKACPSSTLIVEDSPQGLHAATLSGAKVLRVKNPSDLTKQKLLDTEFSPYQIKWKDKKLNIIIPMGGAGKRFSERGYTFPKPLIEVEGKPMIQKVIENLNIDGQYIFIVDKPTLEKYNLNQVLTLLCPGCIVLPEEGPRNGAAYAILLAKHLIDNENPVLIANCDQIVEWDPSSFLYRAQESKVDGSMLVFNSVHPKWSFAKVGADGFVEKVAEKEPISDQATVGIYYWAEGRKFIQSLEQMINKNIRVNNEFYVCPVFNEGISSGLKFSVFEVEKMWGIGTPEDLDTYLSRN